MPNTFSSAGLICTTSLTTLYTCPTTNVNGNVSAAICLMLQATNVTNRADVLTVIWTKASNGNAVIHLTNQVPVPAQQSIGCVTGKMTLLPGDTFQVQCGTFQAVEVASSFLETS